MKRLHSYLTYPFILIPLVIDVVITYWLFESYDVSLRFLIFLTIITIVFTVLFVFLLSDLKRVYIDGTTIYIYDIYSKIPYAVELEEIVNFERDNSRHTILLGIYKITVAVKGQEQAFSFMKNKLIFNVRKYFEDID